MSVGTADPTDSIYEHSRLYAAGRAVFFEGGAGETFFFKRKSPPQNPTLAHDKSLQPVRYAEQIELGSDGVKGGLG